MAKIIDLGLKKADDPIFTEGISFTCIRKPTPHPRTVVANDPVTTPTPTNKETHMNPKTKLKLSTCLSAFLLLSCAFCRSDDTLFDNFGSYVNIEHQEGLDTDSVLIVSQGNVYIGDVDENGYFNALGTQAGTSVWGSQTGQSQVILLRTPVDGE